MAKLHPDLVLCGQRTGPDLGLVCENCEGRCPICDSHVNLIEPVHICGDCAYGELKDRCIVCAAPAKSPAYYCRDCVLLGKDRDGCPRVVNVGLSRSDRTYEKKRAPIVPDSRL